MPILLLSSLSWIVVIIIGGDCCYCRYELIVVIVVMDWLLLFVVNLILAMILDAYVVSVYIATIDKPNKYVVGAVIHHGHL